MKRAFVVCLLLQAVYAAGRNISISIGGPQESPAGVTYVEGKAPEELKAGPTKNSTKPKEFITQAAFIRSGSRDIPKDDEVENEEFERFIKKHHNRPTIETVFVSSSPSSLYDQESEEFNEESSSLRSQAEFFKQPVKNQTFERSVALPTVASSIHPVLDHGHGHLDLAGGISYAGGDSIFVQGDGGQYSTFVNGQYLPGYQGIYGGGEQQLYQVSQPVPSGVPGVVGVPSLVTRTINVAQHALKTKTYEIRRPAIQKHYYDIEERVVIRPAGSVVVELNRPVAKIPTGETVVALGGLQGGFAGFQQSQGAIGVTQGGIGGIGIRQSQGAIGISQGGLQGGIGGIGIQQSQGGVSSTGPFFIIGGPQGGVFDSGFQQSQGGIAISEGGGGIGGIGIQQSQIGIGSSAAPSFAIGGPQGGIYDSGFQQSQGGIAISQGGPQGGFSGIGIQQSQGGVPSTTPSFGIGGPQGGIPGVGTQQSQGGIAISQGGPQGGLSGIGIQQSQGGVPSTTPSFGIGGPQGGIPGVGNQQSQGGIGISQGGPQGGLSGIGIQQSQGGVPSTTPSFNIGGPQGGIPGVGTQQSQGGISISQGGPQGGLSGIGIQQSQGGVPSTTPSFNIGGPEGGIPGVGNQQSQGGISISQVGPQGGLSGIGIQQSQGGVPSTTPSFGIGGPQGGIPGAGTQQSQGGIAISQGGPQGGLSGIGIQQSQGGVPSTTPSFNIGGPQGGIPGIGTQQSQGGIAISQGGPQGGLSGIGIQQSQGAVPSTTPSFGIGGPQGGIPGVGTQQSQGGIAISQGGPQGGLSGIGIQQSQGGVTSTTPSIPIGGPQGGIPGAGFQQSQGAIGVSQGGSQGGFIGTGFQQAPGRTIYSTTLTSYNPFANPTISTVFGGSQGGTSQGGVSYTTSFAAPPSFVSIGGGGLLGSGFQQSQGAIGVTTAGPQGGAAGVGIQQSQGGGIFSTTSAPYLPPASPTPTVSIGSGFQQSTTASSIGIGRSPGLGFQQSQGAIGVTTVGPQGGLAGIGIQQSQGGGIYSTTAGPYLPPAFPTPPDAIDSGFQQSQGAIGISQGLLSGIGIQQSQGGLVSSTTPSPFIPPAFPSYHPSRRPSRPYQLVSTTPASSINDDDSVVVEASANVRNRGTFSSSTTTEKSITANQDASAYARGSSSGSVQALSKNITPFMIAVGEPDFHYPPYVEISSNGSPLGHLQLVPATSQTYPRMRYQGKLLTGEVRTDDDSQQAGYGALSHQKIYEIPARVDEIPPNTPNAQEAALHQHSLHNAYTQYHPQYVGSNQQPLQVSQVSSNAHQQPAQVYRNHFIGTTSRPITITEETNHGGQQHVAEVSQQPIQIAKYRQPAQVHQISQEPIPDAPIHQQHVAQHRSRSPQRTNLVAKIRHQQQESVPQQQGAEVRHQKQPQQDDVQVYGIIPQQHVAPQPEIRHQQQNAVQSNQPHQQGVHDVTQQPNKAEIGSSRHRQYSEQQSHPNHQYQFQAASTTLQPETFTTGQRLYQQSSLPSKYTQHHTINVAPSQHSIFFSTHPQQAEKSVRSQKLLETPPEPEAKAESTTAAAATSSTTSRQAEAVTQYPQQTYASVLANSQPGILYAPSPVTRQHPSNSQHSLRFSSEGSSLFSPSGRHLHLVYSQPSYSQQTRTIPVSTGESGRHYISFNNEGLQAQIPLTNQKQIQLSAAAANNPQQSSSQSQQTAARYESISSTTPASDTVTDTKMQHQSRRQQKYRNEQTRGAITLRSGRTYGDHRVIASTPAPKDGGAASESVQTRRIVVNHPFQTVQEVVEQEPITKYQQITVNEPAKVSNDGLQQDQQKASYRHPAAAYKVAATFDHPAAAVSYRHSGSH